MISIFNYLFEQDIETRSEYRARVLAQRGFGGGRPVAGPSSVAGPGRVTGPSGSESGISKVPAPSKVSEQEWNQKFGAGTREPISGDDWARKFGGGLKKAAEEAVTNR